MRNILSYISLSSFTVLLSFSANAEISNGKELHDANCTSCHISLQGGDGSGIYTRENNRIESHSALVKQVNRCRDSLGMPWPDEHVNDVVEYLNSTYYKFNK